MHINSFFNCIFLLISDPVINYCFIIQTGENEICSKPGKFNIICCIFNHKKANCVGNKKKDILFIEFPLIFIAKYSTQIHAKKKID